MKMYTVKEIEELSIEELSSWMIESMLNVPTVELVQLLPEDFPVQLDYEYDDVKPFIEMDLYKGVFNVPFLDERKEKIYNKTIFSTKGKKDRIPTKGYFNLIDSTITQKPLGLLELQVFGGKLVRKDNETRFESLIRDINQTEYLYYSFEKGKYMKVDLKNEKHQDTINYLEREQLLKKSLSRLIVAEKRYLEKFDDFYFNLKADDGKKDEYKRYFIKYDEFLSKEFEIGLNIKLVFSSVTIPEYIYLSNYTQELREKIKNALAAIQEYENLVESEEEVDFRTFVHQPDSPELLLMNHLDEVKKELLVFRTPRNQKGMEKLRGYVGYDLENGLLFPSISEIERRTYFTDIPSTTVKERDLLRDSISAMKGKKISQERKDGLFIEEPVEEPNKTRTDEFSEEVLRIMEVPNIYSLFTVDEIEEYTSLKISERNRFLLRCGREKGLELNAKLDLKIAVENVRKKPK